MMITTTPAGTAAAAVASLRGFDPHAAYLCLHIPA